VKDNTHNANTDRYMHSNGSIAIIVAEEMKL